MPQSKRVDVLNRRRIEPNNLRNFLMNMLTRLCALLAAASLAGCVSDGMRMVDGHVNNAVSLVAGPQGEPANVAIFVASTRRSEGAADDGRAHFSLTSIGVPLNHHAGNVERPSFGGADRRRHFTVLSKRNMDEQEFCGEVASHVSGRIGNSRDVLLYVHGFNTSADDARYRLAQIVADGRFSGVPALFAWNSRGGLFNYESDKEAATVSRDALEKLIIDLSHTPGVGRIHVLAHSMGAWLTMETLRGVAQSGHADLDGKLGEVMLAAPDIDLNVFRQQVARLDPRHVSIFVASNDRALSLSSRIAGDRPRVGAMNPNSAEDKAELDRLGVAVHDISSFSTDFVGHGAFAEAPDVVRKIGAQLTAPRPAEAETQAVIDARGAASTEAAPAPLNQKVETQPLAPLAAR
ncbi:alpha/beta hydrolase [Methylocystis sp. B8]|uniref:alpha/beta hydrolase n=1 Tax=Methylocystis sp. B8 TaxID=544938 RepID=UPI0010FE58B2|nr:alpha/beta hydrolase [Methylocystis sp. B8]TLG77942.1 alpha/beta hydrolase [Methylocystis sp. B8]